MCSQNFKDSFIFNISTNYHEKNKEKLVAHLFNLITDLYSQSLYHYNKKSALVNDADLVLFQVKSKQNTMKT